MVYDYAAEAEVFNEGFGNMGDDVTYNELYEISVFKDTIADAIGKLIKETEGKVSSKKELYIKTERAAREVVEEYWYSEGLWNK